MTSPTQVPTQSPDNPAALTRAHVLAHLPYTHVDDHFIGGAWTASSDQARNPVTDPATNEQWGSVPAATDAELDLAVSAARDAIPEWSGLSAARRAEYLLRIADEIEARAEDLALTNTLENGTPITETRGAASNAAGIFRHFATLGAWLDDEDARPFPVGDGSYSVVRKDPIGVCALIAPWNFPINLVVVKLAPALLAGCSVVIKPASVTPLSIRFIIDAVAAAGVPAGVVNLLTGPGRFGDRLVRHPDVDKVAFTGSTPVGRRIASACGELLRPVTLELGGKSSAIVLPDADLGAMAKLLIRSCMRNTGQTCYISTRIIAPASRYDEIAEAVAETISQARQGDPLDGSTVFGPVASAAQYATVMEYIESAHEQGANALTGGQAAKMSGDLSAGQFIEPTVFAEVTPEMRISAEEVFGPVISILRYDDSSGVQEAVDLANNTEFGLGGIVFGVDAENAQKVAEQVDSGSVGVNFFGSNHDAPFGGRHDSGLGVEYGIEGLSQYVSYKSIHRRG